MTPHKKITYKLRKMLLMYLCLFIISCADSKDEIPRLLKELNSSDAKIRNDAALGLASWGAPHSNQAVPRLIELMYDQNIGVQSAAAYALRRIDTPEARIALKKASKRR
ncbi:MAG: HEAT repeat domain-containing protein [bacterium]|nr:HEAT repeat domain-containing protein [bacterium]